VNFFDHLKNLLVDKKEISSLDSYVPYMANRWISFISPSSCLAINESVNSLGNLDKDVHYKLILSAFPKQRYMPRIPYVKKVKENEKDKDPKIPILAKTLERSQKEIQDLLDFSSSLP
jgi:hypothetical protein